MNNLEGLTEKDLKVLREIEQISAKNARAQTWDDKSIKSQKRLLKEACIYLCRNRFPLFTDQSFRMSLISLLFDLTDNVKIKKEHAVNRGK